MARIYTNGRNREDFQSRASVSLAVPASETLALRSKPCALIPILGKILVYRGFGEGVGEVELGGLGGLDARFESVA